MNKSVDVKRWAAEEVWDAIDAAFIIAGYEPNPDREGIMPKQALAILSAIKSAIMIGRLKLVRATPTKTYFLAAELTSWATEKSYVLTPGLSEAVIATARRFVDHQEQKKINTSVPAAHCLPPTVSSDPDTCAFAESVMNGGSLDWDLWMHRTKITPTDAAKLIFCIDPIRWSGPNCAQGKIDDDLSYKISMRAALLGDRSNEWSLSSLVEFLGEQDAPAGMQAAVRRSLEEHLTDESADVARTVISTAPSIDAAVAAFSVTVASRAHEIAPNTSVDEDMAALFDSVPLEALEKMFPANGKWHHFAERAARNGLIAARVGRGRFNPYLAAVWFVNEGHSNWDLARARRVLAANLPARSAHEKHKLTGDFD